MNIWAVLVILVILVGPILLISLLDFNERRRK